jgi:hypothetical protein
MAPEFIVPPSSRIGAHPTGELAGGPRFSKMGRTVDAVLPSACIGPVLYRQFSNRETSLPSYPTPHKGVLLQTSILAMRSVPLSYIASANRRHN